MRKSHFFSDLNDVTKYVVHLRISSHCFWYEKCLITFLWRNFHRFFGREFFLQKDWKFWFIEPRRRREKYSKRDVRKTQNSFLHFRDKILRIPVSITYIFKLSIASNRHPSVKLNDLLQNIYGQTETSVCFTSIHDELIKIGCLLPTL